MKIFREEMQKVLPTIRENILAAQNHSQMLSNVSQIDMKNMPEHEGNSVVHEGV